MDYYEYHFTVPAQARDFASDVLPAFLGDSGFESFEAAEDGLLGYAPAAGVMEDGVCGAVAAFVESFPMAEGLTFERRLVADRNWNEKWEQESFRSLVFGDACVVHSPAVTDVPALPYDILIDPKQAFGSGSHETTTLMINRILKEKLAGKAVVDVGCGTAILAILAKKMGAGRVAAFDIDNWAYENAKNNARLNGINDIDLRLGGFEVMPDGAFDYIFANITRNILLSGLEAYAKVAVPGTKLFMSGFLPEDVDFVKEKCGEYGFACTDVTELNGWASVECVKK